MGGGITNPYTVINSNTLRNKWLGENTNEQWIRDSINTGTEHPYCLILGSKGSLLSTTTVINGNTVFVSNITQGINIESDLDGSTTITANASLIIQMISAIATSTTMSGTLSGLIQLGALLSGDSLLIADMGAISFMTSTTGGNSLLTANLRGTLSLEADITPFTTLSPENLAASVWNSVAASFNNGGTMGEIMNNMGAVSDPWSVNLPGSYTSDEAGAILGRLEDLAKKIKAITSAQL